MLESKAAIQNDLGRMEKWADRNLVQINRSKCTVLWLGLNNSKQKLSTGHPARKQLYRKGAGSPHGQAEHESVVLCIAVRQPPAPWMC